MESNTTLTGIQWRKSSYSSDQGGNCVEVAALPTPRTIAVRDSKAPSGPALTLAPDAFATFVVWTATAPE
ncbi:DUF397 domain-containing protein [Streptomyces parvulus]|uniref:DUF397 domain-containing protein n=1 Tax=Streptomyces parvulus TaxID=146923 RepID=UPI0033CD1822